MNGFYVGSAHRGLRFFDDTIRIDLGASSQRNVGKPKRQRRCYVKDKPSRAYHHAGPE
jgi:hypothetical protein